VKGKVRVRRLAVSQPRNEQAHGNRRLAGEHERTLLGTGGTQALHGGGQLTEEPADGAVECLACQCEAQAPPAFLEQLDPDVIGELVDGAADGTCVSASESAASRTEPSRAVASNARRSSSEGMSERSICAALLAGSLAPRRGLGSAWMIVAALLFALTGVFVKHGAQSFTPVELVFWRTLFGVLMLGIPACLRGQRFVTPHLRIHLVRGCACYVALLLTFYVAMFQGASRWSFQQHDDEMFFVHWGRLLMKFRDREEIVEEGEFIVVLHGVEHCPVALDEKACEVLLIDPAEAR